MDWLLEFWARIKESFWKIPKRELRDIGITIFIIAFIFAYDDKQPSFNLAHWTFNYLKYLAIVFLTIIAHESGHQLWAIYVGYRAEYRPWFSGLMIGVIVALLSKGKWYIILPGQVFVHMTTYRRLGHFRHGMNVATMGLVGVAGALANLVMATFWETLALVGIAPTFFHTLAFVNLYYGVWNLLPFPKLDGIWLFFASRMGYVFIFTSLIGYILLYSLHFYSLIFAVLIGAICTVLFYIVFERTAA